ncbi:hypothetical protein, partial [Nonomuraea sp. NPDC003804]|uniref:hypothetical protein n=1 Tax=Nonomuraea sp. NPDC003804 TaxID=3154547 RepID=UPI0033B65D22
MRSVIGMGAVAVLVLGPSAAAEVVHAPSSGIRMSAGDPIPAALKNRTTFQVLPYRPRQSDTVRVFVHCPPAANQAIIGST